MTGKEVESMLSGVLVDPSGSRLHLSEIRENIFITRDNKLIINCLGEDEFQLILDDKILTDDVLGKCYGMRGLVLLKPEVDYVKSILYEPEYVGIKFYREFLTKQSQTEEKITKLDDYEFILCDPSESAFTLNDWSTTLLRALSINTQHYCGCHLDFTSNTYTLAREMSFLYGVFKSSVKFEGLAQDHLIANFLEKCFTWPICITGLTEQQIKELTKQVPNYKRYNIIVATKKYKENDHSKNVYIISKSGNVKSIDKENKFKKVLDVSSNTLLDITAALTTSYLQTKIL